ncbi:hypothetical protein J0X15_15205 [Roseibium sp. CAU 1637]|uniref:Uncharacterized protein n=1 Tax=Roseibium limicola TaxID=2816037 RepID=A0A939ES40_9HYPH|nr:hypothetical protein [Roseibium limicola]MBO0346578.1 hypothetical protein [Roseibium limicola]
MEDADPDDAELAAELCGDVAVDGLLLAAPEEPETPDVPDFAPLALGAADEAAGVLAASGLPVSPAGLPAIGLASRSIVTGRLDFGGIALLFALLAVCPSDVVDPCFAPDCADEGLSPEDGVLLEGSLSVGIC